MTVKQARDALGLGNTKIYELMNAGTLRSFRVGRRRLINVSSIQQFVERESA